MNLGARRPEEPKVSLTPLIDVVLLLLIFFMVSTSFIDETRLRIDLPEASAETGPADSSGLEVAVNAEGRFAVDGRELVNPRPETLRRALEEITEGDRERAVVIRADARAPHQAVVTVMDVAGRMGFRRVNIVTVNRDAEDG